MSVSYSEHSKQLISFIIYNDLPIILAIEVRYKICRSFFLFRL